MELRLAFGFSEANKITPDHRRGVLLCEVRRDITPPELHSFLVEGLRGYDELSIDFSDLRETKFDGVDEDCLRLILAFLSSFVCSVPFSLKSEASPKK